jgi:hypothetical protein
MRRHKWQSCVTGKQKTLKLNPWRALNSVQVLTAGKMWFAAVQRNLVSKSRTPAALFVLLFSLLFSPDFKCPAQDSALTEYKIKAAFIFNFVKFVEWPPQAFANETSPIVIGVLGQNVFGDNLEQALRNKSIHHRPLQYQEFHSVAEVTNCQVLFIGVSEKKRYSKILGALRGMSVLTVSESDQDQFIEAGGMINFVIQENRIHFQVNNEAAKSAGLIINSKLLDLAVPSH